MADKSQIDRLIDQIVAEAPNLQGLVLCFVRKDGNAGVRYTPMPTAMLSHLARILDLKIDREYTSSLFAQAPVVRAPAVHAKPPPTASPGVVPKKTARRTKGRT